MARKKTPRARAGGPKLPAPLATLAGTITALTEPVLIATDRWQDGGVDIVMANDRFAALTGYTTDSLVGRNTRLLHGERTSLLSPDVAKGAAAARLVKGEGWLYRKDGTEFYASWSFSPILADGRPTGFLVALYRDTSEAKRLQEALLHSQKLDTVGLLAGGVAHDFNNLLSVINGYCEIMAAKLTAVPAAQKDLQEIHRAGLKASAIARQILEFSRRQETEVRVINFNTLIREIAEILRRVAGEEIKVELRLASDLGNARMDPTHFQQVLLNLCFNARDAMPQGGKLTIRTYNHEKAPAEERLRAYDAPGAAPAGADRLAGKTAGLYAVLEVSDTGHGMEPAVRDSIFEPFFTTKPHGTGLGLATVLGLIRQHDGHIAVASAPGKGTTFEVFLPETPEPEQTSVTKLGTLPAVRGTENLLIVEEDTVLRKMIAGILATDGYSVIDAATPAEASAQVREAGLRPQLVLTQSCSKDGAALVRELHAAQPRLRLICTSPVALPVSLHGVARTSTVHLPKPFALSALVRAVRTLLDAPAH